MFRLLTRNQAEVEVAPKHYDYVDLLEGRLNAARQQIDTREEYLRTAALLNTKLASIDRIADDTGTERKRLRESTKALQRIRRLLSMGAEPTEPPDKWFCGALTKPSLVRDEYDRKVYPRETWPSLDPHDRYSHDRGTVNVFRGAIPLEAVQRYAGTKHLLDDVRVYSPTKEDFQKLQNPIPRDPVLIGMIRFLGEPQYFEIARWDIDEDLAKVFTSPR